MLIKDFYKIIDLTSSETGITASIKLNPHHEVYKGHFPDQPVVPGVAQLQIVKEILESHFGEELFMGNISQVKYLIPINPNEVTELNISINPKIDMEGNIKTNLLISFGEAIFTKAKITFSVVK